MEARVVVDAEIHDELVARLDRALEEWTLGDPRDPATTIGPMARVDLRDEVARQVTASIDGGAVCVRGGQVPARAGAWYPPTLLTDVRPGMAAFDEEVFGPVVSVTRAEGWSEALSLANAWSLPGKARLGLGTTDTIVEVRTFKLRMLPGEVETVASSSMSASASK